VNDSSRVAKARNAQAAAAGATVAAATAARQLSAAEEQKPLTDILDKLPSDNDAETSQMCERLLAGGPATIAQLIDMVGDEFGDPAGVKPKYALHGLAIYAARPGADTQRKMVAETLAGELEGSHSDELKAFLCRQLQLCGRPEEIPALARLLGSDRLCEPATQALLAIGDPRAIVALRVALPGAGEKRLPTVIKALGRLGDTGSAAAIRQAVDHPNRDVRLMAWYALGNMGDAGSADVLLKAAQTQAPYERTQATAACLLLGRRLAEAGKKSEAEKIFRQLLAKRQAAEDVHDRAAALEGLAAAIGAGAIGDVMAAMDSREPRYRHPAARTAVDLATAIQKDDPQQAQRLLQKVLETTIEETVRQQARLLLDEVGQ